MYRQRLSQPRARLDQAFFQAAALRTMTLLLFTITMLWLLAGCIRIDEPGPANLQLAESAAFPLSNNQMVKSQSTLSRVDEVVSLGLPLEHLTMDEGLSSDVVYSVFQDSLGFIWIGTYNGLNRYDGYNVKAYKHDPLDESSLTSGLIYRIYEDSSQNLWIGTYGGGLDRFDRSNESFIHYRHEPEDPGSLASDLIYAILEDSQGVLWVGTWGGGIAKYEPESDRFTNLQHDPQQVDSLSSDQVYALYEDGKGNLWVGSQEGLNVLGADRKGFRHFHHDPENPGSLSSNTVASITSDGRGGLWVGTANGINHYDQNSDIFKRYLHDPEDAHSISHPIVLSVLLDRKGRLWAGTNGGGLNLFDPRIDGFHRFTTHRDDDLSLQNDYVNQLFEDRAGTIWIATLNYLSKFDMERSKFRPNPLRLAEADLTGSALLFSISQDVGEEADLPTNVPVEENFWIGTENGLWKVDADKVQTTYFRHNPLDEGSLSHDWVFASHTDRQGNLWAGTSDGIDRYDESTNTFIHYKIPETRTSNWRVNSINAISETADGDLWFSTASGISHLDRETDELSHYFISESDLDQRSNDQIIDIQEDRQGQLWVGTEMHGLLRFDREQEKFVSLDGIGTDPTGGIGPESAINGSGFPDFLLTGTVIPYIDSHGRLWVGTDGYGLTVLDLDDFFSQTYTTAEGMATDSVVHIFEDGFGAIWVITDLGLSRIETEGRLNVEGGYTQTMITNFDLTDYEGKNPRLFKGLLRRVDEVILLGERGIFSFNPRNTHINPNQPQVALVSLRGGSENTEEVPAPELTPELILSWPENSFDFEFSALNYTNPEKNRYAYMLEGYDESWILSGDRRYGRYTNLPGGDYVLKLAGSNNEGVWNENGARVPVTIVPPFWQRRWFQGLMAGIVVLILFTGFWLRNRNLEAYQRQLENEVRNRTNELVVLNTIAGVITSTLDEEEILCGALEKTLQLTGVEAGGIYLYNKGSGTLDIAAVLGMPDELVGKIDHLMPGEGYSGEVYTSRKPIIVADVARDGRLTREDILNYEFHSLAVTPLVTRGIVLGSFFVVTRETSRFNEDDLRLLDSISNQVAIGIENARHYAAEHYRADQFQVIVEVGRRLTVILDEEEVLRQVVTLIQQSFGYYHVAVGLVEGDELVYKFGAGKLWEDPDFELRPNRLKIGIEGLGGWVAAHGEPILAPDVSGEPRYLWMEGSTTRSELIVPIYAKAKVAGVLDAQSDRLNAFDDTDLVVMQSLANMTGAALETARLYTQSQQLAVVEERGRLARELHDAVTQTLFSASLLAEALPTAYENDPAEGRQLLKELRAMSRGALAEMRTLLLELRPSALAQTSLKDLLRQLCEAASGREGIPVNLEVEGSTNLPADVHITLYRIAQEALNNIVKHARASEAAIRLCYNCQEGAGTTSIGTGPVTSVILEVRDNGRGFDPSQANPKNLGLKIMAERALTIHADLKVITSLGQGTRIQVTWQPKTASDGEEDVQASMDGISGYNKMGKTGERV